MLAVDDDQDQNSTIQFHQSVNSHMKHFSPGLINLGFDISLHLT